MANAPARAEKDTRIAIKIKERDLPRLRMELNEVQER
jgi:hypothetical protein